mmetsp:Transcript_5900/g.10208  ORF Transcript_5900/g.10208 Transcript_5900/m.10208 type:complete len:99 (-) Transcript_5900:11-307(-)
MVAKHSIPSIGFPCVLDMVNVKYSIHGTTDPKCHRLLVVPFLNNKTTIFLALSRYPFSSPEYRNDDECLCVYSMRGGGMVVVLCFVGHDRYHPSSISL